VVGFAVGAMALLVADPSIVLAKTFTIEGTVDCGRRSGRNCSYEGSNPVMRVHTDDISGTMETVLVDVGWILKHLQERDIEQDEAICMEVEDISEAPGLRAIAFINICGEEGTDNPGLSTDDDEVKEQGDDDDDDDDDDD
jgi:hypothetical protein